VTEQAPTVGQIFRQPSQQPPFTDSNYHAGNGGILTAISNLTTVGASFKVICVELVIAWIILQHLTTMYQL